MTDPELYAFINVIERRVLNAIFAQPYKFEPYEIEHLEFYHPDSNVFIGEIRLTEKENGSFRDEMSIEFTAKLRGCGVDIDIFYGTGTDLDTLCGTEHLKFGFYITKFLSI